jgi:hypothetical protein
MFINDRNESRQVFFQTWKKLQQSLPMEPLESILATVIQGHPEYHSIFKISEMKDIQENDFNGGQNPFLHMGLHIALIEQISTDRPPGIANIYQTLLPKYSDEHQLQHEMMDCLGESLWDAQQSGKVPDEKAYMERLRKLR